MNLVRPLVFFDLETTGTDVSKDRIVEIGAIKIFPVGKGGNVSAMTEYFHRKVNPEMPIPPSATAVHGISDEVVKDKPTFREIAVDFLSILKESDIAGFNCLKFDLPMLYNEFHRAGLYWHYKEHKFIDVRNIFVQKEPRDLTAAVKLYLNKEFENAHGAMADTAATVEVFKAQLAKYQDLQLSIDELALFSNYGKEVINLSGHFKYNEEKQVVFGFGKHKDKPILSELAYLEWMLRNDFPEDTKDLIRGVLKK